ncbi:hypothetical protein J2Y02_001267 [Neobacillus drentensis]|nr:hypothetical protein [Neobacillus drentensis]
MKRRDIRLEQAFTLERIMKQRTRIDKRKITKETYVKGVN